MLISFFGNSTIELPEAADAGTGLFTTVDHCFKFLQTPRRDQIIFCKTGYLQPQAYACRLSEVWAFAGVQYALKLLKIQNSP